MGVSELWAAGMLLAAFAGGAFGASIGALPSFSLAGLLIVVGEVYRLAVRTVGGTAPVDITASIGLGVVLGPHVAFGGGAAALAYASKRGYLDNVEAEFEYHQAKEVTRGLGSRPDVLVVGGIFGVLGYLIATAAATASLPTDPVALGVVVSGFVYRVAFGYSLVGANPRDWFDMSPYEQTRVADSGALTDGGNRTVEPWLPYQYRWRDVVTLGLVVGILGAYIAYVTASPFLAFGISAVSLVFVNAGVEDIPVTHHISLPASTAVVALVDKPLQDLTPAVVTGAMPLWVALTVGAGFGIIGAIAGEVLQRIFYAHADSHFDPPAASIVVTSSLIAILAMVGVVASSVWVPTP